MNNWKNKSDFETNKSVAILEGLNLCEGQHYKPKAAYWSGGCEMFDPCNNPSDSWPIIQRNNIATQPRPSSNEWFAFSICENEFEVIGKNPLRAAMIVYLEMNGVEP